MRIDKWPPRFWAVYDDADELVCVTVYKKGAKEVVRRLTDVTQAREPEEKIDKA
jgi:hypothetical protein